MGGGGLAAPGEGGDLGLLKFQQQCRMCSEYLTRSSRVKYHVEMEEDEITDVYRVFTIDVLGTRRDPTVAVNINQCCRFSSGLEVAVRNTANKKPCERANVRILQRDQMFSFFLWLFWDLLVCCDSFYIILNHARCMLLNP